MKTLEAFALWLVWYLTPVSQAMLIITILVGADFVTGLFAARKRGEKLQSRELRKTIGKTISYLAAIILSKVFEPLSGGLPVVSIVSGFVAFTEFQSNIENLGVIAGVDIWSAIRAKLQPPSKDKQVGQ